MTLNLEALDLSSVPDRMPDEDELVGVLVVRTDSFEDADEAIGLALQAAAASYVLELADILGTTPERIHMVSRITDVQVQLASGNGAEIVAGTVGG